MAIPTWVELPTSTQLWPRIFVLGRSSMPPIRDTTNVCLSAKSGHIAVGKNVIMKELDLRTSPTCLGAVRCAILVFQCCHKRTRHRLVAKTIRSR